MSTPDQGYVCSACGEEFDGAPADADEFLCADCQAQIRLSDHLELVVAEEIRKSDVVLEIAGRIVDILCEEYGLTRPVRKQP